MAALPRTALTIGTRTSELALWQTHHVIQTLQTAWPGLMCELKPFVTEGDKTQQSGKPLPAIGGKGLFTAELEEALRRGAIDLAVHSLKDLPVEDGPGLTIGALTSRADVRDVLVARNSWTLATLPMDALVGTSSTRRAAQLSIARPDLKIQSIRGNVGTRVRKVMEGQYAATVLAAAGLDRLGMLSYVSEWLPLDVMLPAPGQGALAVQCRAHDQATLDILAAIDDAAVRAAVTAERLFLHALGGGCSAPVAAYATVVKQTPEVRVHLQALVASPDGAHVVRVEGEGEAHKLGEQLAQQALAQGASQLIAVDKVSLLAPSVAPEQKKRLQGKRIVVTRAQAQAAELCEQLSMLGATPIPMPMIQIAPMPDLARFDQALQALDEYAWIIFTSANTVKIFCERLAAVNLKNLGTTKVAAVGMATAEALRQHGIKPAFVPAEFVAEQIAAGLGDLTGSRVLLPQAKIARKELAELLITQGACVDAIPVYQTLPVELDAAAQAELQRGIDVIMFTSSSTVRNFVAALKKHGFENILQNTSIACIGPVTAQTAQAVGLAVDMVAAEYSTDGLVRALVERFCNDERV